MTSVDSHLWAFENGVYTPPCDLPNSLRPRVEREFPPATLKTLASDPRRIVTTPASADSRPT